MSVINLVEIPGTALIRDHVAGFFTWADSVVEAVNAVEGGMTLQKGVKVITVDAGLIAASNGDTLTGLLPLSDDDGVAMVIGDFAEDDYLLSSNGANSKLFHVYSLATVLYVEDVDGTYAPDGMTALAAGDTFFVKNDLIDATAAEELYAIYAFNGAAMVKLGDVDYATEIDAIAASLGAVVGTDGAYVAHTTSNYIDTNADVTEDLLDTDAQLKIASDEAAANTVKTALITNAVAGTGDIITLLEPTGGGTDAVTIECPALAAARVITVPDADVTLADIAANVLKTALITNAVAGTGDIITLLEPTGGGTDAVTIECPALGAARVITIPDADVTLANIAVNTAHVTGDGSDHADVADNTADLTAVTVGTAGANVVAAEFGGRQHMTVLTLTDVVLGAPTAGGNSAHGSLVYSFPAAGVFMQRHTWFSIGLTVGTVTTDAPDVGVGSVIGAGGIATLNGTTMEDYVTGITWGTALDGTAEVQASIAATAGLYTGIANNAAGDTKTVHLNVADGWNAGVTGNLTASGTIVIIWDAIA